MIHKTEQKGFGILEVLIISTILSFSMIAIMSSFTFYVTEGLKTTKKIEALYILEEGAEAVRFLRDRSFAANIATLIPGTTYYIATSSLGWSTSITPTVFSEDFLLTVTLEDVYRKNSDYDMVSQTYVGSKMLDPNIKKVYVMTEWSTGSSTLVTYVANLFDN